MIRENCVLCGENITEFLSMRMPVYIGVEHGTEPLFEDMVFCSCDLCGEIQIKNLIDLDVLYAHNHNNGVFGKIWEDHYSSFTTFLNKEVQNKHVVEISDPSAKLAKRASGYKHWTIIEPTPENIELENVTFIKEFFDKPLDEPVDTIVHSHLLEHVYEPREFMKICADSLKDGGSMLVSVPNMKHILEGDYLPVNTLQFEHTYYLDDNIICNLASDCGLKLKNSQHYKNHSIFYHFIKEEGWEPTYVDQVKSAEKLLIKQYANQASVIENTKRAMSSDPSREWYMFGAHVGTQACLNNGLNESDFEGVLDNSIHKQGKVLYGSKLKTYSPDTIANRKVGVVCSHTGVYMEEIVKQLVGINKEVVIR